MFQWLCSIYPREFPGENLVHKITPQYKAFECFTFLTILHNLVLPGENIESLIVPSDVFNFIPMSLDIKLVLSSVLDVRQCLITITAIRGKFPSGMLG